MCYGRWKLCGAWNSLIRSFSRSHTSVSQTRQVRSWVKDVMKIMSIKLIIYMKCFRRFNRATTMSLPFTDSVKLKLFLLQIFEARRLAEPPDFGNFPPPSNGVCLSKAFKNWAAWKTFIAKTLHARETFNSNFPFYHVSLSFNFWFQCWR